jgi:hypothetical protein
MLCSNVRPERGYGAIDCGDEAAAAGGWEDRDTDDDDDEGGVCMRSPWLLFLEAVGDLPLVVVLSAASGSCSRDRMRNQRTAEPSTHSPITQGSTLEREGRRDQVDSWVAMRTKAK